LVGSPGGPAKFVDLKVPHLEPPKWDGPSDEEYYRVTFAAGGLGKGTKYFIGVSFSRAVRGGGHLATISHEEVARADATGSRRWSDPCNQTQAVLISGT